MVFMQISSCVTSTKMQGLVVFFAFLYCFIFQIGLRILEIYCVYYSSEEFDGLKSITMSESALSAFDDQDINSKLIWNMNQTFIKPLLFPVIVSVFIFRHMVHYYALVKEQNSFAKQLFFGKF